MGVRGPVPNRSDQRVRRNKPDTPVTKIHAGGSVKQPEMLIAGAHPIISMLWDSLGESAQAKYYEASDWATARYALHLANQQLWGDKPNGQIITAVNSLLASLMVTEGDRRRLQVEVERKESEGVVIDVASMFAEQLSAQKGAG